MHTRSVLLTLPLVWGLSGCANHPLPEDISRKATVDIVEKIRCEALGAVILQIVHRLKASRGNSAEKLASEFLDRLGRGDIFATDEDILRVRHALKEANARKEIARVAKFEHWVIGYNFKFAITEVNNKGGKAGFKLPLTRGTFTLNFEAGLDRTRAATREFKMVDSFQDFRNFDPQEKCRSYDAQKNWIYPITGSIGLAEIMDTYFVLYDRHGEVEAFTDKLEFTTKITGSVKPAIVLSPVTDNFHLASANLDSVNNRTDLHQVTITLRPPDPKTGESDKDGAFETLTQREALDAFRDR